MKWLLSLIVEFFDRLNIAFTKAKEGSRMGAMRWENGDTYQESEAERSFNKNLTEVIKQLDDPEAEELLTKLFELYSKVVSFSYDPPSPEEQAAVRKELDELEKRYLGRLFVYASKKRKLCRERGITDLISDPQWRDEFLRAEYIRQSASELDQPTLDCLFDEAEKDLDDLETKIKKSSERDRLVFGKSWSKTISRNREAIEALLPLLSEIKQSQGEELLAKNWDQLK
ncbi:MAG: hypothetical protein HYT48_00655 [Candidatus Vogelbacteria bacterium]|nr:hypothetical protein [Candidatus Vogelbacteria bacterium]